MIAHAPIPRLPVDIEVSHSGLLPPIHFQGPAGPPVDVQANGDITIDWAPDEGSRELRFAISDEFPESRFEGIQLLWPAGQPDDTAEHPAFQVSCPPDSQGRRRTLVLVLERCLEDLGYSLCLWSPGGRHRIDPMIYNKGDGRPVLPPRE